MSPTNQTTPSSPDVDRFSSSAFSNFPFNAPKSPIYIFNPTASTTNKSSTLEPPKFSCMSQPQVETIQYSENNNSVRSKDINLNNKNSSINIDHVDGSQASNTLFQRQNSTSSEAFVSQEQTADDKWYLGVGGRSMWRGEGGPGSWVRKMGYAERFMTGSADFGVMSTVYNLWFESKKEIEFHVIEQACYIVARKLPHLRLAVGKRNGDLWFKEMEKLKLDVEEMQTDDIMHTFETVLKTKLDLENGPLWFVRYIKIDNNDSSNTPVMNKDTVSRFVCLFGFHHNFTDGTTNMKFCNVFLKVLNDLLLDRAIDLKVEAKLVEPFHDRIADKMTSDDFLRSNLWLMYYFCKRFYKGIISYGQYTRNYTNYYHQPVELQASTRLIPGELDEATTSRLMRRCKEEKATLNSVFTAVANIAIYKMVLDRDDTVDDTHFGGIQTINMRRYWSKEQAEDSCGCHISTLDVRIPTNKRDLVDFWGYARRVQETMDYELNVSKRGIKLMPIGERLRIILYTNAFLEWAGYPSTNDNHYCVTNMGNLGKMFPGTGEVVEVTKLLRTVSCHYMPNLCQHTLHTFRGKLCYSLDYYTQKMERSHAKLYAKMVMDTLVEVIDEPRMSNL